MKLRDYQQACVDAIYGHLRYMQTNPCAVLPTGAGKTLVIAQIVADAARYNRRVCVLAHAKELLQQCAAKLHEYAPDIHATVYSAGLGSRDASGMCVIAGIQSVYKRACEMGRFDLILIDEAHLIPSDGEGMYRTFLNDAMTVNPDVRIIGLTATPYRTDIGMICQPDNILQAICYDAGVKPLIEQGYLCPLTSKATETYIDADGVGVRGGDFIASELAAYVDSDAKVQAAVNELKRCAGERKSILVFCAGVEHAHHVAEAIGNDCAVVTGDTPKDERAMILDAFREQRIRYLTNVNVLTTGFDAPNIDCIAMLRPTLSPGLYYQMVGRGLRAHTGKANCLVLDFAGNVQRHGPIDLLEPSAGKGSGDGKAPTKTCPQCKEIVHVRATECPACGYEYPVEDIPKHATRPDASAVISDGTQGEVYTVDSVKYVPWTKKNAEPDDPQTVCVEYYAGYERVGREWVCPEHVGFARRKFEQWWAKRCPAEPAPLTVRDVVEYGRAGCLAEPERIVVMPDGKYSRVYCEVLSEPLTVDEIEDRLYGYHRVTVDGVDVDEEDEDMPF